MTAAAAVKGGQVAAVAVAAAAARGAGSVGVVGGGEGQVRAGHGCGYSMSGEAGGQVCNVVLELEKSRWNW